MEMHRVFSASPSFCSLRSGDSFMVSSSTGDDDLKYTSLKDVGLPPTPLAAAVNSDDGVYVPDFDSSAIPIRNHLVKHAASAYLQSAAILAARDRSYLSRLWGRLRRRTAVFRSAWSGCARGPVDICAGLLAGPFRLVLSCLLLRCRD